jgi:hypothetical protein
MRLSALTSKRKIEMIWFRFSTNRFIYKYLRLANNALQVGKAAESLSSAAAGVRLFNYSRSRSRNPWRYNGGGGYRLDRADSRMSPL